MARYYRRSSWRHPDNLAKRKRWSDAYVRQLDDGTTVHSQREDVGYGFTSYMIVGSFDGVSSVVKGIYTRYPTGGYGTHIHWPPDPERHKHYAPYEQLGPDLWVLWCRHSESCD